MKKQSYILAYLYGQPVDMPRLRVLQKYNLKVVEDVLKLMDQNIKIKSWIIW